jgi:hypothetical protein
MNIKPLHFSLHTSVLVVLLILCFAVLESCSTTQATKITGSWRDPEAKNYKDFFVAVLSKNLPARSTLEGDISRRLKREGVKVTQSLDIFSHTEKLETAEEKKAAVEKIQGLGHDAIITVTLVRHTEENRYVPGANSYTPTNIGYGSGYYSPTTGALPAGNYSSFGGYYTNASSLYQTPGYYEMDKTYFVESRMFDTKTSRLVWSAQSETFNPGDLDNASDDFSLVMVDAMKQAKLIYKAEKGKK